MIHDIFKNATLQVLETNQLYGFEIVHLISHDPKLQLIYTNGLSNYTQPVSEGNEDLKHLELYFLLPEYWNLKVSDWPVTWMNRIAQIPQKNKTWFGVGDTIPAGNPPAYIDDKQKTSYFIISKPIQLAETFVKKENQPQFLAVIPIFKKEFDFKMQNSSTILFNKFKEKGYSELVDIYRTPVARKRFMGVF